MRNGPTNEPSESELTYRVVASGPPIRPEEVEADQEAIEVVLMWGTDVLHVAHIGPDESFVVGEDEREADFLVGAELLGSERLVVVDHGRVQLPPSGSSDAAEPGSAGASADEEVRFEVGGLRFITRRVRAGKKVAGGAPIDRQPLAYVGGSLGFAGLLLLLMSFVPASSSALSFEHLDRDSRLVAALMTPPSVEFEEPAPTESGLDAAGGDGERAAGDEGQAGDEDSPVTHRRFANAGPADNPDEHLARERAEEMTRNAGVIGTLRAMTGSWNAPTSPFGRETALGSDPRSALGSLMGAEIGDDFGFGGLGLHGTGRGANGTGLGTVGLDTLGTIGHGAGCRGEDCGSDYGRGTGRLRARRSNVPDGIQIGGGAADVHGTLAREVIRRVVRRHRNEIRFCYEQGLQARPDLEGRVTTRFLISPTGTVTTSLVAGSTVGHPPTEQCIVQAIRRWTFPSPDNGGVVSVTYPFVLQTR